MTIGTAKEEILRSHVTSLQEGLETLLSGCTKSNDIKSDANILLVKQHTDALLQQYQSVWQDVSRELEERDVAPEMNRAVSVDRAKFDRVKNVERAIQDRETRLAELQRKLHALRRTVPQALAAASQKPSN